VAIGDALLARLQAAGIERDDLIEQLKDRNIGTSVHYIPTHHFSAYRELTSENLEVTDRVWRQIISLPLYPTMSDDDARDVIEAIKASIMAKKQPSVALAS